MVVSYTFFFASRRRHTRCALVTGVQTCALPIYFDARDSIVGVGVGWWPALREGFALARAQHVHAEVAVERLQARGQGLGKRLRRGSCIESAGVRGRAQALRDVATAIGVEIGRAHV